VPVGIIGWDAGDPDPCGPESEFVVSPDDAIVASGWTPSSPDLKVWDGPVVAPAALVAVTQYVLTGIGLTPALFKSRLTLWPM
jgi:hypothetical protein